MSFPETPAVSPRVVASLVIVLRAALGSSPELPLVQSAARIGMLLGRLRPIDRRALGLGISALSTLAILRHGKSLRSLPAPAVESLLRSCRGSRIPMLRRLAGVLVRLVLFAHYDGPETWAAVSYEGPWLGRIPIEVGPPSEIAVERMRA